ncbi:hypothetical protein WHZ78_07310 [Bradyrhizobium symbiodeficiens]|uniref:hypothetical protein n=1 Tax=Bradyrhizobium symbiodeficiens TaxID=1404367 RepID=UPI0030CDAE35
MAQIDETLRTEFWRDHDGRPDPKAFRPRSTGRVPPSVVRAQTRLRTAAWRNRKDRSRSPDSHQIGLSMVKALITSRLSELTWTDRDLVARMLLDLRSRGFSIEETKQVLRRMRTRYVDPGDRADQPDHSCGPKIRFKGEEDRLPF